MVIFIRVYKFIDEIKQRESIITVLFNSEGY